MFIIISLLIAFCLIKAIIYFADGYIKEAFKDCSEHDQLFLKRCYSLINYPIFILGLIIGVNIL